MTLMSLAQFSRRVGKSRAAVTQWKNAGRLVMQGDQVDVEASEAYLQRYRREGKPAVVDGDPVVKRGRPRVKHDVDTEAQLNNGPVCLTCDEIEERLRQLDWKRTFDWSDAAQHQRAVDAARCVGWEAVQSDLRDDGHWGGYQLRIPGHEWGAVKSGGVSVDAVAAGHGYELSVWDVLKACRDELEPIDEGDVSKVVPAFLPVLAHPFGEWDKPR
jgi:hypothetical protein